MILIQDALVQQPQYTIIIIIQIIQQGRFDQGRVLVVLEFI